MRAVHARCHVERPLAELPPYCGIISVLDGHPATLAWLGAVCGHRVRPLGVEHFGQTGSLADLYRYYGIDSNAIVAAAQAIRIELSQRFAAKIMYSMHGNRD